jgi:hypothetical protein
VRAHPFFSSIDFDLLMKKEIQPPYVPKLSGDPYELNYFDSELVSEPILDANKEEDE